MKRLVLIGLIGLAIGGAAAPADAGTPPGSAVATVALDSPVSPAAARGAAPMGPQA